jgi:histone H3/H4
MAKTTVGGKSKRKNAAPAKKRVTTSTVRQKPSRPRKQWETAAEKDIRELRKKSHKTNEIPQLAFTRVVKEISDQVADSREPLRWSVDALQALQYATEDYLTHLYEDA